METKTLNIPSINCHHCIMTIKRESSYVSGVEFLSGDIEGKTATFQVEGEEALKSLKKTLAEVGYPVSG